jgi:uncharacterized protein
MTDPESSEPKALPKQAPPKNKKPKLRPWVRAIHRDAGYLAVGLTIVYAASGIAVNHIADYKDGDASYTKFQKSYELGPVDAPKGQADRALAEAVVFRLAPLAGPLGAVRDQYRSSDTDLEVTLQDSSLRIDLGTGHVEHEGKKPRFFLRFANWLHLNRGKKAWTYMADAYAAALLFLALSGLVMIPGKKGFFGRGAVLALLGAAIPVVYIQWFAGQ